MHNSKFDKHAAWQLFFFFKFFMNLLFFTLLHLPQKRFYKHCIWESHHCHGHRVTSINAHFTVLHNSHTSRLNPSQRQNFWIQRDARNDKNTIKLAVTDTVKYGLQLWNIPLVIWLRLWVHTGCICACTHPSNPCPSIHSSRVLLSNWSRQVSPCL